MDTSDEFLHFLALLISYNYYKVSQLCTIHWSSYHGSLAKLVQNPQWSQKSAL